MATDIDSYFSIDGEARGLFRDKASKFLAFALPVSTVEDVKEKLEELRKSYHDANHHCYAYRLGTGNQLYRFNDDGEPSGSAGKPIYGQLLSTGLSDVLVVVVRYFGGTKLGIPGLINAYRTAAREALDAANVVEKVIVENLSATFGYPVMNEVMKILKDEGAKIIRQDATEKYHLDFQVRKSHLTNLQERLGRLRDIKLEKTP